MRTFLTYSISAIILLTFSRCTVLIERKFEENLQWRAAEYKVKRDAQVAIPVNDSTILRADIYHPVKLETAPTILIRVPLDNNSQGRIKSKIFGHLWAKRGYNVIIQGVRGKFDSDGKHIPFENEREDGINTLKWLNQQSWHNGMTGMWGGSYFGYTQFVLFDQKELGLNCLFTHIASTSNFDMFHPNGSFALETALFWASRSHPEIDTPLPYEKLKPGYDVLNILEADNKVSENIPFYNDWASHTSKDAFWITIDGKNRMRQLEMPITIMGGWFDPYLTSQINDFEDLKKNSNENVRNESKLIIGPWGHAQTITMPDGYLDQPYREASLQNSLDWYDKYLAKKEILETPPVKLFVMGINEWRYENEFPLERTVYTKLFLNPDVAKDSIFEGLLNEQSTDNSSKETFTYDPNNPVPSKGGAVLGPRSGTFSQNEIEKREDVKVFTTAVLSESMEITGKIELELYVSTDALSTDFTAKLLDVYPNGEAYNIAEGILRREYIANEITKITIELNPTSIVFLKDHKIRLEISSSNYPRYSRNLNTGKELGNTETKTAHQTLFFGGEYSSFLLIPLIPSVK